jgi:hypothetical protein
MKMVDVILVAKGCQFFINFYKNEKPQILNCCFCVVQKYKTINKKLIKIRLNLSV